MTVAAIVLVPDKRVALSDADGEPVLRRLVQSAWAGGALPIVAVAAVPSGSLSEALTDLPASVANPERGVEPGAQWFVAGLRAAMASVTETTAGLMWPFRYAWVDPETVTSLVEAHGADPASIVRPAFGGEPGFPILVPASLLPRIAAKVGLHGREAVSELVDEGVPLRLVELGDPGITHDIATARADLPGYQGPTGPAGGPPPEWNAALAARVESAPEG
jgi:molybdenum cofactor cytidylyltransferase